MTRDWRNELLEQLQGSLHLAATQKDDLHDGLQSPWWLSALLGLAAWISSAIFIFAFLGSWLVLVEGPGGRGLAGVLLIGIAVWMFSRAQLFTNQVGLALSLTGQGLLVLATADHLSVDQDNLRPVALVGMLIAGILLWLPSSFLHRHVCTLLVLLGSAVLIGRGGGLALYAVLLAVLACALWLSRQRWAAHGQAARIRALADAATLLSLLLAAMPHGQLVGYAIGFQLNTAENWVDSLYSIGIGLLLLAVVAWLGRVLKRLGYGLVLGITLLLAVLAHSAPGFVLSVALALALFHGSNRSWLLLLPAFTTFYLFVLYYSLHISLLQKSLLMIVCGGILLVGARLLPLWLRRKA